MHHSECLGPAAKPGGNKNQRLCSGSFIHSNIGVENNRTLITRINQTQPKIRNSSTNCKPDNQNIVSNLRSSSSVQFPLQTSCDSCCCFSASRMFRRRSVRGSMIIINEIIQNEVMYSMIILLGVLQLFPTDQPDHHSYPAKTTTFPHSLHLPCRGHTPALPRVVCRGHPS